MLRICTVGLCRPVCNYLLNNFQPELPLCGVAKTDSGKETADWASGFSVDVDEGERNVHEAEKKLRDSKMFCVTVSCG